MPAYDSISFRPSPQLRAKIDASIERGEYPNQSELSKAAVGYLLDDWITPRLRQHIEYIAAISNRDPGFILQGIIDLASSGIGRPRDGA